MKIKWLFILVLLSGSWAYGGPRVVGNGGDVVRCFNRSDWLTLDFVLAQSFFGKNISLVPVRRVEASLARMQKLIEKKAPQLSLSFAKFMSDYQNQNSHSKSYFWFKTQDGLDEISDEGFDLEPLPTSCRRFMSGTVTIRQAIVRWPQGRGKIYFEYDEEILRNLSALQLSMILVHEWLWDHSLSAAKNRKINYFLHSNLFDQVSVKQAQSQLARLGLTLPKE